MKNRLSEEKQAVLTVDIELVRLSTNPASERGICLNEVLLYLLKNVGIGEFKWHRELRQVELESFTIAFVKHSLGPSSKWRLVAGRNDFGQLLVCGLCEIQRLRLLSRGGELDARTERWRSTNEDTVDL